MASRQLYDHNKEVCIVLPKEVAAKLFTVMQMPFILPLRTADKLVVAVELQKQLKPR